MSEWPGVCDASKRASQHSCTARTTVLHIAAGGKQELLLLLESVAYGLEWVIKHCVDCGLLLRFGVFLVSLGGFELLFLGVFNVLFWGGVENTRNSVFGLKKV